LGTVLLLAIITNHIFIKVFIQTVKSFLPDIIMQDSGHIVTMASLAGITGCDRLVDYCASKFAAVGFDESLRTELDVSFHSSSAKLLHFPFIVTRYKTVFVLEKLSFYR
jgi:hypothetical protein